MTKSQLFPKCQVFTWTGLLSLIFQTISVRLSSFHKQKSVNLQYNTLVRWTAETKDKEKSWHVRGLVVESFVPRA